MLTDTNAVHSATNGSVSYIDLSTKEVPYIFSNTVAYTNNSRTIPKRLKAVYLNIFIIHLFKKREPIQ